jgi:hypothetical protein
MSRFCATSSVPTIQNQHCFGCPTYVLKKKLQDHKKIRKWSDRTRVGINLGYSSRHDLIVSLVLNLQPGLVSPQYHCQYDDLFETTTGTQARSVPTSQWQYKSGLTTEKPELDEEGQINENLWEEQSYEDYYSMQESVELKTDSEEESLINEVHENPDIYVTRSGRKSKPPERLQYDVQSCLITLNDHEDQESWNEQHLLAFKASTDPDTIYHHQAMKQPDREKFKEAMQKECEAHYKEVYLQLNQKEKTA